jgi:hypothetical protein
MSIFNFSGSGGILVNGTFIGTEYYYFASSNGGVLVSGDPSTTTEYFSNGNGGILVSGNPSITIGYFFNGNGEVLVSGQSSTIKEYGFNANGGVLISGDLNITADYFFNGNGQVLISGNPNVETEYFFNGNGGIDLSGNSKDSQVRTIYGSGGVDVSGKAQAVRLVVFKGSGGVTSTGKVKANVIFNPTPSGGVIVGGNSKDRILYNSKLSYPISFDLGDLPIYAYRVTGYCEPLNCDTNPFSDPQSNCGHQIVNYVLARSITDLCAQLQNYDYIFRVKAVYRYDKAILGIDNLNDIQSGLVDPNCPKFEDVTDEFCLQAECFDFCLLQNAIFLIKANFTAAVYVPNVSNGKLKLSGGHRIKSASAYSYNASGNYEFNGNAVASGNNLIPNILFSGSGKQNLTGNAGVKFPYLGVFSVTASADISVEIIGIDSTGGEGLELEGDTLNPVANICGCKTLLNYVDFQTNLLTKTSVFSNFAYRNNLTINKNLRLYYNQKSKTFYNSVKFDGYSTSSNNTESWNLIVELACTNQFSRFGDSLWNFSIFLSKKNYDANHVLQNNLETRFYVYIPSVILYTNTNFLEFDLQVDMKNLVVYDKFKQIIYDLQPKLTKDNIKLFSSGDWVNNPYLNIFTYTLTNDLDPIFRPNKNVKKINILSLTQTP